MNKRNHQIDFLKGLGIFLVVFGHANIPEHIYHAIYSFHMPLFFFISGYLTKRKENESFIHICTKQAKSTLVPYIKYFFISLAFVMIVRNFGITSFQDPETTPKDFGIVDILKAIFLSNKWLYKVPVQNFPLWYLPLFTIAVIIFKMAIKFPNSVLVIISLIFFTLSAPVTKLLMKDDIEKAVPLSIQALFPALFFIALGFLIRELEAHINLSNFIFLVPILFFVGFTMAIKGPRQILFVSNRYMLSATILVLAVYISTIGASSPLIELMGRNSLPILGLHKPLMQFINESKKFATYTTSIRDNTTVASFVLACFLCFIIILLEIVVSMIKANFNKSKMPQKRKNPVNHNSQTITKRRPQNTSQRRPVSNQKQNVPRNRKPPVRRTAGPPPQNQG